MNVAYHLQPLKWMVLAGDLASFFASSFHCAGQSAIVGSYYGRAGIKETCLHRLDHLYRTLPSRFRSAVKHVAEHIDDPFDPDSGRPCVPVHGDLSKTNVFVNRDSGNPTGVIDVAELDCLPFGFDFYAIDEVPSERRPEGWTEHADAAAVRAHFWSMLLELTGLPDQAQRAVRLAWLTGILFRYGTRHDAGFTGMLGTLGDSGTTTTGLLPDDIQEDIRKHLSDFKVENKFCFHLLHNHATLEPGQVMIGQKVAEIEGSIWARPMPIDKLDPKNIRGHIFVLDMATGNFGAYELREGAPAPMSNNDNAFVAAFRGYLVEKKMTRALGLELLPEANMVEYIFNNNFGTFLMKAAPGHVQQGRTTANGAANGLKGNVVSNQDRTQQNLPHYMLIDSKRKAWEEQPAYTLGVLRENGAIE
ncbi:hypothetical protein MAPG_10665 [Magnaporthiopsis poae ATCC 64411]|uniref:Aminoglycoside phosphotransferase domain-containing protein n=1 Tax=Magnaporthiopsis poae (strain ATCC 64411 / 73-15) TaxID=644358 RepID=A0A0C4ED72_MAGP6|nr:hypothetical protein MAPG_10665 [Magnaporthiopsis poae ATCC 64411]